jgi:hypothetical protein
MAEEASAVRLKITDIVFIKIAPLLPTFRFGLPADQILRAVCALSEARKKI